MRNLRSFLMLLLLPFGLLATDCIPNCECETDWTLEVRGAYYQPCSKSFAKVYTRHLLDYQVEAAKRIHPFCEIWGGISWASKHGHTRRVYDSYSYEFKDKTQIFILPVSLGAKLIYPIMPYVDLYAGAGVCYSFLRIHNHCNDDYSYWGLSRSPFKKEIHRSRWGAIFKVGFQIAMSDSTFLDIFADYYSQHFHISSHRSIFKHDLDCSGFKIGAGLGVYF